MHRFNLYITALAALAGATAAQAETRYRVIELQRAFQGYTEVTALSEGGLMAVNQVDTPRSRGFICHWKNGCQRVAQLVDGSAHEYVVDLADNGMAVGRWARRSDIRALVWVGGQPQDIGSPDQKASSSAEGVNNLGVVVGWEQLGVKAPLWQGFVWRDGVKALIGTLPDGTSSFLWGISDTGIAVGKSDTATGAFHAFTYDTATGAMTDLGTLAGDHDSEGFAVNSHGDIAGISRIHAVRTVGGFMQNLGALPGDHDSIAFGINDQGEVVGVSSSPTFVNRGFLYDAGGMHDLNDLLVGEDRARYTITWAADINNHGDVAAKVSRDGVSVPAILKRVTR